ncbi:GIY-YIG nuclease family protein [candidate division KSB1 bacterium]|nr:GIY-YIG nuclease family protein [candidate division KSB1 bacterium]RQW00115.1 MAG: GIY-YIG nuclease family protein [candidate division KSB1 bacterium]
MALKSEVILLTHRLKKSENLTKSEQFQTYQLYIKISHDLFLTIGQLGQFCFPAGLYIYTGSAKRSMDKRLTRHLAPNKKLRWHIDYLLNNPCAKIIDIKKYKATECQVNAGTNGRIIVPGFGASDCRAGCGSHLKYCSLQQEC